MSATSHPYFNLSSQDDNLTRNSKEGSREVHWLLGSAMGGFPFSPNRGWRNHPGLLHHPKTPKYPPKSLPAASPNAPAREPLAPGPLAPEAPATYFAMVHYKDMCHDTQMFYCPECELLFSIALCLMTIITSITKQDHYLC